MNLNKVKRIWADNEFVLMLEELAHSCTPSRLGYTEPNREPVIVISTPNIGQYNECDVKSRWIAARKLGRTEALFLTIEFNKLNTSQDVTIPALTIGINHLDDSQVQDWLKMLIATGYIYLSDGTTKTTIKVTGISTSTPSQVIDQSKRLIYSESLKKYISKRALIL